MAGILPFDFDQNSATNLKGGKKEFSWFVRLKMNLKDRKGLACIFKVMITDVIESQYLLTRDDQNPRLLKMNFQNQIFFLVY